MGAPREPEKNINKRRQIQLQKLDWQTSSRREREEKEGEIERAREGEGVSALEATVQGARFKTAHIHDVLRLHNFLSLVHLTSGVIYQGFYMMYKFFACIFRYVEYSPED